VKPAKRHKKHKGAMGSGWEEARGRRNLPAFSGGKPRTETERRGKKKCVVQLEKKKDRHTKLQDARRETKISRTPGKEGRGRKGDTKDSRQAGEGRCATTPSFRTKNQNKTGMKQLQRTIRK